MDPTAKSGHVYFFLQTHELATRGLTKIGWAANPARRLSEVQVGNPYQVEIAALFPGRRNDERHAHGVLAPYRVRGEWFALQGAADVIWEAGRSGETLGFALAAAVAHLQEEHKTIMAALETEASGGR